MFTEEKGFEVADWNYGDVAGEKGGPEESVFFEEKGFFKLPEVSLQLLQVLEGQVREGEVVFRIQWIVVG